MWIYKILIYRGVILKKAMIYVHGKGGSYLEAEQFKNICLDFDVFGVDYNDYFPWIVKNNAPINQNFIYPHYTIPISALQ